MKKNFTLFVASLMMANLAAIAEITPAVVWEHSGSTTDGIPAYIGTGNNCRNMDIGTMNGENILAVASREGGTPSITILKDEDGSIKTTLDMTGISQGQFSINDVQFTADNKILACNMAMTAKTEGKNHFIVYRWDNLTQAPSIAIDYPLVDESRFGDEFTVTGSIDNGTAKVYAANANMINGTADIICFSMIADPANSGKYVFSNVPTVFCPLVPRGTKAPQICSLTFLPNGNAIYLGSGTKEAARLINADGTDSGKVMPGSVMDGYHTSPMYLCTDIDGYDYVGFLGYQDKSQYAIVNRLKDSDVENAERSFTTPVLGSNNTNGNGTGRIQARVEDNALFMYVLMTNNGIAKYKINGLVPSGVESNVIDNDITITAANGIINVSGIEAPSIEVYNTIGQKVVSQDGTNQISINAANNMYIVVVKANGKIVKTQKIIL